MEKSFQPYGSYVLLRFEPNKSTGPRMTKGGVYLVNKSDSPQGGPPQETSEQHTAYIHAIGDKVKEEDFGFKIGDAVIFNEFDLKMMSSEIDDEFKWGFIHPENLMAKVKIELETV